MLAKNLVTEALGASRKFSCEDLYDWWGGICFYEDVVGVVELSKEEQVRLNEEQIRLSSSVEQKVNLRLEFFQQIEPRVDNSLMAEAFYILAKREFEGLNKMCK